MKIEDENRFIIPKDAKQDLVFHYNRSERYSMVGAPPKEQNQSFFKKYRGVLIILADILIIGLVFIGTRLMFSYEARPIGPYAFEITAYRIKDKVFATLSVEVSASLSSKASQNLDVDFYLEGFGQKYSFREELPQEFGQVKNIRAVLDSPLKDLLLTAEIFINKESRELSVRAVER